MEWEFLGVADRRAWEEVRDPLCRLEGGPGGLFDRAGHPGMTSGVSSIGSRACLLGGVCWVGRRVGVA